MKEKIEAIKNEYIQYGVFANTLDAIDSARKLQDAMKRHDCDLNTLILGMKSAAITQIEDDDYIVRIREIR